LAEIESSMNAARKDFLKFFIKEVFVGKLADFYSSANLYSKRFFEVGQFVQPAKGCFYQLTFLRLSKWKISSHKMLIEKIFCN